MSNSSILSGGWDSPTSVDRNNIVFEGKNKNYGAYVLRNEYAKKVNLAVLLALSSFLIAVMSPHIIRLLSPPEEIVDAPKVVKKVTKLDQPPPMEDKPIPPQIQAPDLKQVKFTPPVIKPDEEVTEDAPTMEELKTAVVGSSNVDGAEVTIDVQDQVVNNIIEDKEEEQKPVLIAEVMPLFPGGEEAMMEYIRKNYRYPQIARENGIEGTVHVQFVVATDGDVKDVSILRGIHPACDQEAVRVVRSLPRFKPGKQGGKPVPVIFNIPVNLTLGN